MINTIYTADSQCYYYKVKLTNNKSVGYLIVGGEGSLTGRMELMGVKIKRTLKCKNIFLDNKLPSTM